MSFSSRCIKFLRMRLSVGLMSTVALRKIRHKMVSPGINFTKPAVVGMSLFTLLGFEQKPTAEDELIKTIKHCILFIQRKELQRAEQLLHVALRQAQQINHKLGITYIYDVMANLALEQQQLDKAKQLFVSVSQRLMADGATENDIRIIHISVKLARISHLNKEFEIAQIGYDWCLQKLYALESVPKETCRKLIALAEDWYGRLFLDCRQYENGFKLMQSAFEHMQNVSDTEKEDIVRQLNDLGTVCNLLNKVDEAISYFQQAIKLGKQLESYDDLAAVYINLGRLYMKKNLLEEARKSCGHGWKLATLAKNEDVQHEANLCIQEIKNMV